MAYFFDDDMVFCVIEFHSVMEGAMFCGGFGWHGDL